MTQATIKLLVLLISCVVSSALSAEDWVKMREQMVRSIELDTYQARRYIGKSELSDKVLESIGKVPRHEFVPAKYQQDAYVNQPLPIGRGQTISQPFIVALMTDLMEVDENSRVLELGTGSGYQAAVLAELVREVYTIEIVEELGKEARNRLQRLGYENVHVKIGDGFFGWPAHSPYDSIIVTAAGIEVPPALIEQLKPGGHLVIPVGPQHDVQYLKVITKLEDGSTTSANILPVRFVPITGEH